MSARFAGIKLAARLKANKKVLKIIPGELGELLVLAHGLKFDDTITLGLKTFLGLKLVDVKGIRVI